MKTKEELLEFIEIEEVLQFDTVLTDHPDWDSIVALDLANYCEKLGIKPIGFDYIEWFFNLSWNDLFKELHVQ